MIAFSFFFHNLGFILSWDQRQLKSTFGAARRPVQGFLQRLIETNWKGEGAPAIEPVIHRAEINEIGGYKP